MTRPQHRDEINVIRRRLRRYETAIDQQCLEQTAAFHGCDKLLKPIEQTRPLIAVLKVAKPPANLFKCRVVNTWWQHSILVEEWDGHLLAALDYLASSNAVVLILNFPEIVPPRLVETCVSSSVLPF
jgi:hypothetical protein